MYPVYFENSIGEKRIIGECSNKKECIKIITKFLDNYNFNSYYTRINYDEPEVQIDVGSHTEFFYVSCEVFKDDFK